jgi:hypothetical protein
MRSNASVAFSEEELTAGDNAAIIRSAQAEGRLPEALCFCRNRRSYQEWLWYLRGQKRLERSMRRPWCSAL